MLAKYLNLDPHKCWSFQESSAVPAGGKASVRMVHAVTDAAGYIAHCSVPRDRAAHRRGNILRRSKDCGGPLSSALLFVCNLQGFDELRCLHMNLSGTSDDVHNVLSALEHISHGLPGLSSLSLLEHDVEIRNIVLLVGFSRTLPVQRTHLSGLGCLGAKLALGVNHLL